jgi:flagellar motor switch protein FliM
MTDPVLSDDEKSALLDGVSSGAVEVLTGGEQKYADVRAFQVNPRSRIKRNSFPRLQVLNDQLADRLKKHAETSLQCEVAIMPGEISVQPYSEICAKSAGLSAVTVFSAPPLEGQGGIVVDSEAINQIVEAFFGGGDNDNAIKDGESFSPGELSVCRLFCAAILSTLQDVWESCVEVEPESLQTEIGMDLVDIAADSDRVLSIPFTMKFQASEGRFELLLPMAMLSSLLPVFEGQKGERDAADDARWEQVIRSHLPDTRIRLTGNVGRVRVPLAALNGVKPGDVLRIENPRSATVFAGDVPVVHGRYGVHAGRNAVETTGWA